MASVRRSCSWYTEVVIVNLNLHYSLYVLVSVEIPLQKECFLRRGPPAVVGAGVTDGQWFLTLCAHPVLLSLVVLVWAVSCQAPHRSTWNLIGWDGLEGLLHGDWLSYLGSSSPVSMCSSLHTQCFFYQGVRHDHICWLKTRIIMWTSPAGGDMKYCIKDYEVKQCLIITGISFVFLPLLSIRDDFCLLWYLRTGSMLPLVFLSLLDASLCRFSPKYISVPFLSTV